jgi:broad specificity phosphatase PhoE
LWATHRCPWATAARAAIKVLGRVNDTPAAALVYRLPAQSRSHDTEEAFRLCGRVCRYRSARVADRGRDLARRSHNHPDFVRAGQSTGNASGLIDTSVPGPNLSDLGYQQAATVSDQLRANGSDGIYASTMVRPQETAAPLSQAMGKPVTVLPGLREIEAGQFEGRPEADAQQDEAATMAWLRGDRSMRIPGSINGSEFNARLGDAVKTIYDSGNLNPVAFSHHSAVMVWVLMNVKNPDNSLLTSDPLPNIGHIVVVGSPQGGWTLKDWNGNPRGPPPEHQFAGGPPLSQDGDVPSVYTQHLQLFEGEVVNLGGAVVATIPGRCGFSGLARSDLGSAIRAGSVAVIS